GTGALHRVPGAQPDGRALVAGRALRHRVLPQRDDLFRRRHAAPRARAHAPRDGAARPAVRWPLGELHRFARSLPPARQDDLRAPVSAGSSAPATLADIEPTMATAQSIGSTTPRLERLKAEPRKPGE